MFVATNLEYVGHNHEDSEFGMQHKWFSHKKIDQVIRNGKITADDTLAIWVLYKVRTKKSDKVSSKVLNSPQKAS